MDDTLGVKINPMFDCSTDDPPSADSELREEKVTCNFIANFSSSGNLVNIR